MPAKASPMRILVVEDDETLRNNLTTILALEGYSVATAENGQRGIERVSKEKFDLIITDISMPRLGGVQMIDSIRKRSFLNADTPIIVFSGTINMDVAHGIKGKVTKAFCKPVESVEVLNYIRIHLDPNFL
ncbi:response regulator [Desulfurispirillum indicum]|uniref:Response regulator receiver n=1 Tax=Desulfurispirillum indicum (strain ATCC BAA-1389 / DSM 22839 / S5) TaxID=653733 RepID=E6W5U1_DESIS|nr:response regulator [Desulfurispirillum indicum]ADU67226.1 response regulator receiver [Desulfurispirillum indicum S5]UCZ56574.1 response regulator [Desulfurispirillum indicum]